MTDESRPNVYTDDWQRTMEHGSFGVRGSRVGGQAGTTRVGHDTAVPITPAQRRVLIALCRPYKGGAAFATPATNPQIAAELFLSVAAVKSHLRGLTHAFGIDALPQQEKRQRLVAMALQLGVVRDHDL